MFHHRFANATHVLLGLSNKNKPTNTHIPYLLEALNCATSNIHGVRMGCIVDIGTYLQIWLFEYVIITSTWILLFTDAYQNQHSFKPFYLKINELKVRRVLNILSRT